MKWLGRIRYRLILSYPLAVWTYGAAFACISGIFPKTLNDWVKFILMPFLTTIQLPFLFMKGHGWLFVLIVGALWTGIYYLLKACATRRRDDPSTAEV